jgi:predicted nucleic acid-binding protein
MLFPLWVAAGAGEIRLISSELLLLETLVKPLRMQDVTLEHAFRQLLIGSDLELVPITRPILERAAQVRATANVHTPDAIHAATALTRNCAAFLSNDKGLHRVKELPLRLLSELANG